MKNRSRKNRLHWNLENCRYDSFLAAAATLDSTQKKCSEVVTDGEELRNR